MLIRSTFLLTNVCASAFHFSMHLLLPSCKITIACVCVCVYARVSVCVKRGPCLLIIAIWLMLTSSQQSGIGGRGVSLAGPHTGSVTRSLPSESKTCYTSDAETLRACFKWCVCVVLPVCLPSVYCPMLRTWFVWCHWRTEKAREANAAKKKKKKKKDTLIFKDRRGDAHMFRRPHLSESSRGQRADAELTFSHPHVQICKEQAYGNHKIHRSLRVFVHSAERPTDLLVEELPGTLPHMALLWNVWASQRLPDWIQVFSSSFIAARFPSVLLFFNSEGIVSLALSLSLSPCNLNV